MLFSSEMVRALIEGRKSQSRRLSFRGAVGDKIWVKETFKYRSVGPGIVYRADDPAGKADVVDHAFGPWKPSIFMPKKACRIWLQVDAVRQERLQEISEQDALAEGMEKDEVAGAAFNYAVLWDKLNGKRAPFGSNPLVTVITFHRLHSPPDPGRAPAP